MKPTVKVSLIEVFDADSHDLVPQVLDSLAIGEEKSSLVVRRKALENGSRVSHDRRKPGVFPGRYLSFHQDFHGLAHVLLPAREGGGVCVR